MFKFSALLLALSTSLAAIAAETSLNQGGELSTVHISAEDGTISNKRQHTIESVDVISKKRIDKAVATTLNDAVDRMPGVDSQDYCVNCGAKRISINGLRGDHTSVLIDGIPLYSSVTSVYGYDTISMQSVSEIEVKRGTGSALKNPEAIGGSINIITLNPDKTGTRASTLMGDHHTQNYEILTNYVNGGYKLSLGGDFSQQEVWDVDHNNFAESPYKGRSSFFLKQIFTLSDKTQWATRLGHANMEIIGGNTSRYRLKEPIANQASDMDFQNGDVRNPYTGDISRISEYIHVKRTDATSKLTSTIDGQNNVEWNLGAAVYNQTSYYLHAFDYITENKTLYTDVRWNHQLAENQIALLGLALRNETLRSASKVMYEQNGTPKDDFDYRAYSLFAQYDWMSSFGLEVSAALRAEQLDNRWIELNSLSRSVLSPRLLLKWQHDEHLSQQFAYGQGYRLPLTSIESAHGAYDGFVMDIQDIEKSQSVVYSVSYNTPEYYITPSLHYTRLENMSYPLDSGVAHSGPLRFVTDTDIHNIYVADILTGFKPHNNWLVEIGYENFSYPKLYKEKLPTAAIEERVSIRTEYETDSFTFILSGYWIGARDISKYYQYSDHYNVSDGLFGVSEQKWQRAPEFWQWDLSLSQKLGAIEITGGVLNIFNYTQTGAGDSPAMWHLHGDHAHLDNRHVWGPNRGREYYLKLALDF